MLDQALAPLIIRVRVKRPPFLSRVNVYFVGASDTHLIAEISIIYKTIDEPPAATIATMKVVEVIIDVQLLLYALHKR